MYKIVTDTSILMEIDSTIKLRENNLESKYCEPFKHPIKDEWIIPIDETLLKMYNPSNLDYLLSDNISEIPGEYDWPFSLRPIRVFIPFKLQAKAQISKAKKNKTNSNLTDLEMLGELLSTMLPLIPEFMIVNGGNDITIYLEELYPQHRYVLELFDEIKIEEK